MADRLIDLRDIAAKGKVGQRTAYKVIKSPGFPAPRRLSGRIVRWLESEVDAYFAALPPALDRHEPERLRAARERRWVLPAEISIASALAKAAKTKGRKGTDHARAPAATKERE